MTRSSLIAAVSVLALSACAGRSEVRPAPPPSPGHFAAAMLVQEPSPEVRPATVTVVQPELQPEQLLPPPSRAEARERGAPASRVEAANRAAVREPRSQSYVNATQVYAWSEGAIYRLKAGIPSRYLPPQFGAWQTVHRRHQRWSLDGTWDRVLSALQADADRRGELDWSVSVDSTIARVHQHGATAARSSSGPSSYTGGTVE